MTTTAPPTLDVLREASREAAEAEIEAAQRRARRDALALEVYEQGAVTYGDLAAALGVTRDRVSQVLAGQRQRRTARP